MGWWAFWWLTGIVNDGSVVLGLDTGQVDHVAVGRAQIRRLGRAMATAAHEAAARSLDQSARHPAQEEELATSTLVLALQFTCLCPITWICIQLLLLWQRQTWRRTRRSTHACTDTQAYLARTLQAGREKDTVGEVLERIGWWVGGYFKGGWLGLRSTRKGWREFVGRRGITIV